MKKAFIFPGQGSQVVSMGKDFYDNFDVARKVFNEVDEALGEKLSNIIFNGPAEDLTATQNAQPALMCVSMAILRVLEQEAGMGIEEMCDFVAGHSLGEYSALCASGAISIADTARLLRVRGNAMAEAGKAQGGSMAAIIGVDIETADAIAKKSVEGDEVCQVANDNSIGQVVISGTESAIDRSLDIAKEMGAKRAIKLPVAGAFHSALMAPAKDKLKEALDNTSINMPNVSLLCNVKADIVTSPEDIRNSLVEQITGRVRWREILLKMHSEGVEKTVEIGSGKVLSGLTMKTVKEMGTASILNIEAMEKFLEELK